jgi:EAL domain-containing protein (putative c-di-GMP-specific phosphodiesterase class I)/GGDEF domain-containing protein/PAS domain-containing protein
MALMAEQDFDVILLDQHLPDFEGNEILITMKADTRLAAVPVIMISAGDESRQIGTSLKLGADDYVAKPIDQILLRARLAACLDRKRLRERNTAFWFDSLNKVMDLAVDGIVILTAAGDVETANPIACDIFAISAEDFTKRPFGSFLGQPAGWTPGQWLASEVDYAVNESILREIPGFRANGAAFPLEIAIRGVENAEQPRFVAICRDATIRRAEEERMAFLARHDPTTELPNRAVFIDWINEALAAPVADGVLILIGVSGLRDQIEGVSLQQGTHVLRAIAMDIVRCLPTGARLASLGNDQFGIAIDFSFSNTAAELLADRIMAAVPHVVSLDGAEIDLEVWGGITRFPEDGDNPAHLIRNLELALARARRERDRSTCMFHKDMWNSYRARRTMERDLAEALELGKFELHFQPKVRISDFQMSGGEALIRWRNGDHGYVSPAEFIPVAESTGLIVPLGQFVIDETVRRIAVWIASGLKVPTIAFNASSVQFRRTDLVRILRDATLSRGVACSYLEMEITESVLLHDRVQVSRVLSQLRNLGIKIAIDDFGTGHSSLSYLAELPIDTLKIDQSFIRQLEISGQNREIVRTVVQLAQSLGLQTVAEGVEELGQAQFLRATGCNIAQGYYFSRPIPAEQFARLFTRTLPVPDSVI